MLWVPSPDILRTVEGIVEVIPNRVYKALIEGFAPLTGLKEHYVLAEIGERKVHIEGNYTTGRYAYVPASQKHSRYPRGLLITEYINPIVSPRSVAELEGLPTIRSALMVIEVPKVEGLLPLDEIVLAASQAYADKASKGTAREYRLLFYHPTVEGRNPRPLNV